MNRDHALVKHLKDTFSHDSVSFTAVGADVPLTRRRTLSQTESCCIHKIKAVPFPGLNDTIVIVSFCLH